LVNANYCFLFIHSGTTAALLAGYSQPKRQYKAMHPDALKSWSLPLISAMYGA
jgi:hypothetical protein